MASDRSALLKPLQQRKTALLTTYRRDGTGVATPVTIAVDGEKAYFRTYDKAFKAKRLRRNPELEIAPATVRGKPRGAAIRGRARLLDAADAQHARRLLGRRAPLLQRLLVPLAHRLAGYRTLHYELVPIRERSE